MSKGNEPAFSSAATIISKTGTRMRMMGGLTKREYFAAAAMQGLNASLAGEFHCKILEELCKRDKRELSKVLAMIAVRNADDLLVELAKAQP